VCLLFCNVDDNGKITESIIGERIIPSKQYEYFFFLMEVAETVSIKIPNYRIIDGQLTLEEGA
jgi:hypothetical protein